MSAVNPQDLKQHKEPLRIVPQPKPVSGGTLPHGSKDQEIENLKRLLASVSQRLDALKSR